MQVETTAIDAENELAKMKRSAKEYQAQAVDRALGGNAEPAPVPPVSAEELEFLIVGLTDRQDEVEHEINVATIRYDAEAKRVLSFCIERASEVYRERADALVDSWHELNAGQMAQGGRDLSWMHLFIPAIAGMRGRQDHHSLATLFSAKDLPLVDGGAVMSELESQLR